MGTKARAKRQRASGFDWILKGLDAGLLFVLPLIFYRGFAEQFSTGKTLLAQALVALGLAAWSAALRLGKTRWPSSFKLALPLGALAAAALISCLNSPAPSFSLIEAEYFLSGPLWLLMWVTWSSGVADVRRAAKFVAAAGGVAAAVALLQWAGHDPLLFGGYGVPWGTMVPRMRLYSTFGNPNLLCGYLIGAIFPALALALIARSQAGKIGAWCSAAFVLAAIVGTGSYGGWAALIAGAIAAGLVYRAAQRGQRAGGAQLPKMAMKSALPVWLVAALVLQASVDPSLLSRAQGRLFLWRAAWPMFREHPLIGSGWGTFQLRFLELQAQFLAAHREWTRLWTMALEAHNDPYQILLETGLLGIAALVWLAVEYGRGVWTLAHSGSSRESVLWLSAGAGGVVAIFTNSLVNFQLAVAPTLILLFTLLGIPQKLAPQAESAPLRAVNRRATLPAAAGFIALCGGLFWGVASRAVGEMKYQAALEFESQGDFAAAEQSDRAGIAAAPWNGRLRFALARALYLQQKYPDALAEARLAERAFSDSHLEVLKARILDRVGRGPEALASYRRALYLDPTLKTVQSDIERLEQIPSN
ncbi:MAG: O-antigen ligase family protein [Deltaproteobacteria bacterium]